MGAVLKNSIINGFKELRAAAIVVPLITLLTYFVMNITSAENLVVVVGVPMLIVFPLNVFLGRVRISVRTENNQAQVQEPICQDPQQPARVLSKPKALVYGVILLTMIMSFLWAWAFLFAMPFYAALGISAWIAVKGFGWMLLVSVVGLTLLIIVAILEVWKFSTLIRKIVFSLRSLPILPSHHALVSVVRYSGYYDSSNSEIRHT